MIAPAIPRAIAAALADETTGVNALLPTVPGGNPEPRLVTVFNTFDNDAVALNQGWAELSADAWILSVGPAEEIDIAGDGNETGTEQDAAPVFVHLSGLTKGGESAATLAEAHSVMRCVRKVLHHLFRQAYAAGGLELDGQYVDLPEQWKGFCKTSQGGSGQFDLMLAVPFQITDNWARSAPEL